MLLLAFGLTCLVLGFGIAVLDVLVKSYKVHNQTDKDLIKEYTENSMGD